MRDRPDGAELLDAAGALLRETLLPVLPDAQRHAALMILNAMAIAGRQLRAGEAPARAELQSLHTLPGMQAADGAADAAALRCFNRGLVARIRAGEADPGQPLHQPLHAHLRAVARQRLAESNPKALPADGA